MKLNPCRTCGSTNIFARGTPGGTIWYECDDCGEMSEEVSIGQVLDRFARQVWNEENK